MKAVQPGSRVIPVSPPSFIPNIPVLSPIVQFYPGHPSLDSPVLSRTAQFYPGQPTSHPSQQPNRLGLVYID